MIFILDFILLINLWVAFKFFKNLAAPPILMGAGMLAASLMATSYYTGWEMDKMLPVSVFILGGGTCFFTFCCIIYARLYKPIRFGKLDIAMTNFPIKRIRLFFWVSIAIGCLGIVLKLYYFKMTFGSLGFSELILAKRMDDWSGTNDLYLPSWVRQMGSYTSVVSNFTIWLFALMIGYKKHKIRSIRNILYIHLCIVFVDGMLSGSKAPILNMFMQFGIFYLYIYYALRGSYRISRNVFISSALFVIFLALSFRGLSLLIGRNVEDRTNSDLLAEYCGAEIKNFDIYMHRPSTLSNNRWGENTFSSFYKEIDEKFFRENGEFQSVGNYSLGNVYTQYRPFYEDWGMFGIFIMNFVIAVISMFFYEKSKKTLVYPQTLNPYLFIYAGIAMSIFMAFFSSKFTETFCRLGGVRNVMYIVIMTWFIKKYILEYKNELRGKL